MAWYRERVAQVKEKLNIPLSSDAIQILSAFTKNGKRGLVVGGAVRDALMGFTPKDIDIEVYGFPVSKEFVEKGKQWDVIAQKLKYTNPESPEYAQLEQQFKVVQDEYLKLSPLKDLANFLKGLPQYGQLAESEGGVVGKSFGIIKFRDTKGNEYDFSLPRTESKTGAGHASFRPVFGNFSPKQAAARRDFTFNAMGYDPLTTELHDYFGGEEDLKNKIMKHTSPAFDEDPLRVLRGMQFAARFGFEVAPETAKLCRNMMEMFTKGKLTLEPSEYRYWNGKENIEEPTISRERIAEEFMKMATKSKYPSKIFKYLIETGWINFFPQLKGIVGVKQDPQWHPEGDVEHHVGHSMDAAVEIADRAGLKGDDRATLLLAAMCHDLGKATNTQFKSKKEGVPPRWTSYGHDQAGGPLAEELLNTIGIKRDIVQKVRTLVENHMRHVSFGEQISDKAINKLADKLHENKATIEMLVHLIEADLSGRPPLPKGLDPKLQRVRDTAEQRGVLRGPLQPFLRGQDILDMRPDAIRGPWIGNLLSDLHNKQKAGQITSREQAMEMLKQKMNTLSPDRFKNEISKDTENPPLE